MVAFLNFAKAPINC